MAFFDDNDPFESILREFMGGSGVRRAGTNQSEQEDRTIDFIETHKKIYTLFELPGYNKKDVLVAVKGPVLEIQARKNQKEAVQDYLMKKLGQGVIITKELPKHVNGKKFTHTMKHGVLEIVFEKKK